MKRNNCIIVGLLTLGLMACEMRDELKKLPSKEELEMGWFTLDVASQAKTESGDTKAVFDRNDVDPQLYPVEIINTETGVAVHRYDSYADLLSQGQVKLTAGKYKVVAYNYDGSNTNASERPWFKGETEFEILAGKTTKVNTTCKLQNIAVTVVFSEKFKEQFKDDYAITVTNGDGGVKVYEKEHLGKTFYFKVPARKNCVQLTVKATTTTNNQIAQNYTVTKPADSEGDNNLVSGDEFTVNIDAGDEPSVDPTTQMQLNITVDLTMHETGMTIEIPTENIVFNGGGSTNPDPENPGPVNNILVTGLDKVYTISIAEMEGGGTSQPVQVSIDAKNGITELGVQISSDNSNFMSTLASFGLEVPFDLANPGDLLGVLSGSLEEYEGIGLIDPNDPIRGKTEYLFDITHFMSLLPAYGVGHYEFAITVQDGKSDPVSGVLTVNVVE